MKEILFAFLCFVLFVGIVLAILFHKSIKNIKTILRQAADAREARRMAEEDEYFKRTSNKNYRQDETPKFKDDYFKGTEQEANRQQQAHTQQNTNTRHHTVETDSGVTIIDDRSSKKSDRKIFDDNEGEYIDFVEVEG
ncbi:MAG: DUF4834 family protein [Prevotella sp.]|nr:DUF4834 family protein [Prevotella sp.]